MNTNSENFDMIFKRKSFHLFENLGDDKISQTELREIEEAYKNFKPLYPEIKTEIRIVPNTEVNFKNGSEYCILIYSEKKENYLMNIGYIGEQLDLYLVKNNIGSLWFGLGKPDKKTYNGLDFVIMFAIRKVNDQSKYRRDMYKSKRKPLSEIWKGDDLGLADITRFSPSACNSQPWFCENENGEITVYRYKKQSIIGIVSPSSLTYFNRIDIGIYLFILETCLEKNGIEYKKVLFPDMGGKAEFTKVAKYTIEK